MMSEMEVWIRAVIDLDGNCILGPDAARDLLAEIDRLREQVRQLQVELLRYEVEGHL